MKKKKKKIKNLIFFFVVLLEPKNAKVENFREFQPTLITRFLISFLIEMWIFFLLKIFQLSLIHFLKIKFFFLIFFSPRIFTIFCFSLNFQLV